MPNKPNRFIRRQRIRDRLQFARRPPVVAIQKRNNLARALRNPRIKRRRLPAILFANQPDPRRKFPNDLRRPVGRTVVDDDDFAFRVRDILLQHADKCFLDEPLMVVGIDENADVRPRHLPANHSERPKYAHVRAETQS